MSFFQSIGGYQTYLQNALSSASSFQDTQIQEQANEASLKNEDNIANQALQASGLQDLFLGSPIAIKAITEGKGIYNRAKTSYKDIKESYDNIKAKAQDVKDFLTTSPDKIKQLKEMSLGEGVTPEALKEKMTELFGEKYANSAVGKIIMDKVDTYKKGFEDLKTKLGEHLEAGNELHANIEKATGKLSDILQRPAEQLSSADLDVASHFKNIIQKAHGVIEQGAGELEAKRSALEDAFRARGLDVSKVASYTEAKINKDFERMKSVASKVSDAGEVIPKMAASSPLAEIRQPVKAVNYQTKPVTFENPLFNPQEVEQTSNPERFIAKDFSRVEPTVAAPRNVDLGSQFSDVFSYENAARTGLSKVPVLPAEAKDVLSAFDNFKSKAGSAWDATKSAFTSLGESAVGKVTKGLGGAALEGVNILGGIQGAEGLAKGQVNAMNILQTSSLKSAPAALGEVGGLVQKGVSSISQKAGDTLASYAEKAKQGVSDTMDLIKANISAAGEKAGAALGEGVAEKVGTSLAEKGLGELGLEAGLATIPVVGEIADIGLGIGSIVSAVKDLFHKPAAAPIMPTIAQGLQLSRQAGVY